jgi:hypothetical protein
MGLQPGVDFTLCLLHQTTLAGLGWLGVGL